MQSRGHWNKTSPNLRERKNLSILISTLSRETNVVKKVGKPVTLEGGRSYKGPQGKSDQILFFWSLRRTGPGDPFTGCRELYTYSKIRTFDFKRGRNSDEVIRTQVTEKNNKERRFRSS